MSEFLTLFSLSATIGGGICIGHAAMEALLAKAKKAFSK